MPESTDEQAIPSELGNPKGNAEDFSVTDKGDEVPKTKENEAEGSMGKVNNGDDQQQNERDNIVSGLNSRTARRLSLTLRELSCYANILQRAWRGYFNRCIFKSLKSLICRAEKSLTYEILRRVIPAEAELLKDPSISSRVRFRFGGEKFPPKVMYKVFAKANGNVYFSGKKFITAGSKAAEDALIVQGPRLYLEKVLHDSYHNPS